MKCEKCSVLTPYLKVKKDTLLEELKSDIDCFFREIDWLGALSFVGGEPFLYPYLEEYLEYFMSNYHAKIRFRWNVITNGTILPSSKTLEILKQFGGNVSSSDYSLEFDFGFSEQGYVNMCRRCNGYLSVNQNYVEVAKQAVRNGA